MLMASETVRTTVLLPERVYREVQALAAASDVSSAWIVRQAVIRYLADRGSQTELPLRGSAR